MTAAERTEELAAHGDLDGLLRHLDDLVDDGDWDEVLRLRRLARAAIDRGHQVWPAATHAEYRLALEAPPEWCAQVLVPDAGRFALGPLAEVAACHHTWAALAPHLPDGPVREQFALERVVRGEDLHVHGLTGFHTDLPLTLAPWEPAYPLAAYTVDEVTADAPTLPPADTWISAGGHDRPGPPPTDPGVAESGTSTAGIDPDSDTDTDVTPDRARPGVIDDPEATDALRSIVIDDPQATDALRSIVAHWVDRSNGRCEVLAVEGDHLAAIAALGVPRPRMVELEPATALALLAWAAGSGGAEGRRRGMAAARFDVWWLLVALAGLVDEWPLHPDEVGEIAHDLRWFAWDASEPTTGWALRLVVEDRTDAMAWIIAATDG